MIDSSPAMIGWERSMLAAEKVKDRMRRAAALLDQAGVPYAVVGGNAVASCVGRIDEEAVRNTRDVDILIRRTDLDAAKVAMQSGGFVHCQGVGVEMFLDGPDGRPSSAVHLLFAGEKVEEKHITAAPDVSEQSGFTSPAIVDCGRRSLKCGSSAPSPSNRKLKVQS